MGLKLSDGFHIPLDVHFVGVSHVHTKKVHNILNLEPLMPNKKLETSVWFHVYLKSKNMWTLNEYVLASNTRLKLNKIFEFDVIINRKMYINLKSHEHVFAQCNANIWIMRETIYQII